MLKVVGTGETCAGWRQAGTSRVERERSSQDGCERLRVYRAEQDLSGVVKRMGRWDVQGLGQRGGNGETGGDCCGYGYVVWAHRDSGRTSEWEMRADP